MTIVILTFSSPNGYSLKIAGVDLKAATSAMAVQMDAFSLADWKDNPDLVTVETMQVVGA